MRRFLACTTLVLTGFGCGEEAKWTAPPCGSGPLALSSLVPGPGDSGHDVELAAKAFRYDRIYFGLSSYSTGMSADLSLAETASAAEKAMVESFAENGVGYDFLAFSGKKPEELFVFNKSTGLYSGAGIAADAYRYGVLRDSGSSCAEIEHARGALERAMDGLSVAARIDGVAGVTARSVIRTDLPNTGHGEVTPLFDELGRALPLEKNNGTWRAPEAPEYPNWIWEDSISRDMLLGWAFAYGAVWEVIKDDDTFDAAKKSRLQEDARDTARALMKVQASGYDLEIPDADGRPTFHAYLNENAIDRLYVEDLSAKNGFHAVMSLGIVGSLAFAAEDAEVNGFVHENLVSTRLLPKIASDDMLAVNMGIQSNFSNFNMAFTAMLMAQRYLNDAAADGFLLDALERELWTKPEVGNERQPKDMHQSLFDLTYAAGRSGAKANAAGRSLESAVVEGALGTLREYPDAPVWDLPVENCDAEELASKSCVLVDGTQVTVLGDVARNGGVVTKEIIPMRVRPRSNYHWRSDPYKPNGDGGGRSLYPAVDWRMAYWFGRWVRENS
ncbi:MAG: hypothetical protein HY791_37860 [Deltaproteobacteria bacterium]|nr:hypothetical protein [Deltaproteobacteria bacterium]